MIMNNWTKIVEYGEHPHALGLQRFGVDCARGLVRQFGSLRARLARRFGGVPVYVGHPDEPAFAGTPGHDDTRAHGWVQELDAREDGLYGRIKWADTGRELLANAHYKFLSPRWAMRRLEDGAYEPVRLISVGLTNMPNIPGDAIANAVVSEVADAMCKEPEEAVVLTGFFANSEAAAPMLLHEPAGDSGGSAGATGSTAPRAELELANAELQARLLELEQAFVEERRERVEAVLSNAVQSALIAPHARAEWEQRLTEDFDTGLQKLNSLRPLLNTRSQTENLGRRRDLFARRTAIVEAVNARMDEVGEDYTSAWAFVKRTRAEMFAD